jgi:glycosyltransferase involved in cell wall biosynthesis
MHIAMIGVKGLPHPGGIENVVEQLGTRLVARGHTVTVYVRPHFTPRDRTSYNGMRLVHLPSIPTKHFDAISHSTLAVLRAQADVVHIHSTGLAPLALWPRLRGMPTVVQSHGLDWQRAKWGWLAKTYLKLADWASVACPTATIVVSRKLVQYYQKNFHRQVHYIPNGVNVVEPLPPKEITRWGLGQRDYLLFASRLVPEKGCHLLLDAFDQLKPHGKKLVIAGDENYDNRYASELKRRGRDDVLFLGFVRGAPLAELMSNAYLFVQPSFIEGLSTGLLEAMSYGNAVVASDIEENREAIGAAGFTFQSGQAADLAKVLAALLADERAVAQMRPQAQKHVLANYSWDSSAAQCEALYYSLAKKKSR